MAVDDRGWVKEEQQFFIFYFIFLNNLLYLLCVYLDVEYVNECIRKMLNPLMFCFCFEF